MTYETRLRDLRERQRDVAQVTHRDRSTFFLPSQSVRARNITREPAKIRRLALIEHVNRAHFRAPRTRVTELHRSRAGSRWAVERDWLAASRAVEEPRITFGLSRPPPMASMAYTRHIPFETVNLRDGRCVTSLLFSAHRLIQFGEYISREDVLTIGHRSLDPVNFEQTGSVRETFRAYVALCCSKRHRTLIPAIGTTVPRSAGIYAPKVRELIKHSPKWICYAIHSRRNSRPCKSLLFRFNIHRR